jgi:hypothetical protein
VYLYALGLGFSNRLATLTKNPRHNILWGCIDIRFCISPLGVLLVAYTSLALTTTFPEGLPGGRGVLEIWHPFAQPPYGLKLRCLLFGLPSSGTLAVPLKIALPFSSLSNGSSSSTVRVRGCCASYVMDFQFPI